MEKREKATDIDNKSYNPFIKKKVGFADAYPQIEKILVEVNERGKGARGKMTYSAASVSNFINCSNERCYNGGFRLGSLIDSMCLKKETEKEFFERCQGYEGSPKGKKRYGDCENTFSIKIKIEYKAA